MTKNSTNNEEPDIDNQRLCKIFIIFISDIKQRAEFGGLLLACLAL